MKKWEYLSVRYNYVGRGITQEFDYLDVNGQRLIAGGKGDGEVAKTLPEYISILGETGWELVNHTMESEEASIWHYMHFKRPRN